jgi:hypothetical protein
LTPEGHLTVFDIAKTWILASNDPSRNMTTNLTRRGSEPYDFPEIHACNKLVSMPKSYAQLHASVKSLAPSLSDPAICLVCGSILDGGGSGAITAHIKRCSGDAGLAFLLQQSMVLMLHGDRCAYAPSPYVDDHGKRQKSKETGTGTGTKTMRHLLSFIVNLINVLCIKSSVVEF